MSQKAVINLRDTAREALAYAQRWGQRRAVVATAEDSFLHLPVEVAASCGYRTVAVVFPSGASNFVEASSQAPNRHWFRDPADRAEFAAIFRQLDADCVLGTDACQCGACEACDSRCRTPGCTEDANDGEGQDGYCGNCADHLACEEHGEIECEECSPCRHQNLICLACGEQVLPCLR